MYLVPKYFFGILLNPDERDVNTDSLQTFIKQVGQSTCPPGLKNIKNTSLSTNFII